MIIFHFPLLNAIKMVKDFPVAHWAMMMMACQFHWQLHTRRDVASITSGQRLAMDSKD